MGLTVIVGVSSCLLALIPVGLIRGLGKPYLRGEEVDILNEKMPPPGKQTPEVHGRLSRVLEF